MKPKVLELEDKIKLMQTNMTLYHNTNHVYNHTGSNATLEEPIIFDYSSGNPGDLLSKQNWGIKIGAGVNHINVKAYSVIRLDSSQQNSDVYITIRKNGNKLAESSFYHT